MPFTTATEEERDRIIKEILAEANFEKKVVEEGKRVLVTGKGGVGKTVITAILSHLFARAGVNVLAVDEDPQMNLPLALGIPVENAEKIVPLSKQIDYIEEKTGARPGNGWGLFLKLNPDVRDVVERFGVKVSDNLNLLVMGTVVQPAIGCTCPENDLLDAVIRYINLRKNEVIVMDTEAGLEHFGRAIAKGFHDAIVVSEPTLNSLIVSYHALRLSKALGIPRTHLVINKIRNQREMEKVQEFLSSKVDIVFDSLHFLPYDEQLYNCEPSIAHLLDDESSEFMRDFIKLFKKITEG